MSRSAFEFFELRLQTDLSQFTERKRETNDQYAFLCYRKCFKRNSVKIPRFLIQDREKKTFALVLL